MNSAAALWGLILGIGIFEALSGLAASFIPGLHPSVEVGLLLHVVVGFIFLWPLCIYLFKHIQFNKNSPEKKSIHVGEAALLLTAISLITGLVATAQAAFSNRVPPTVKFGHKWGSYIAILLVVAHLVYFQIRQRSQEKSLEKKTRWKVHIWLWAAFAAGIPVWMTLLLASDLPGPVYHDALPAGYDLKYGSNPFAPSNATTATNTVMDSRRLENSQSCKTCHPQIYKEWKSSAHHWSSSDIAYKAVSNLLAKEKGSWSTNRYCAGCHAPADLLSGKYTHGIILGKSDSREGSSCAFCHGIHHLRNGTEGNGNYIFSPAHDYLFAYSPSRAAQEINSFLIRAYPQSHQHDYASPLEKNPKLCSSCHKQYIPKAVNNYGFVQLQDQYDDWLKGHYHHINHPAKTLNCLDCHMRLVPSKDPARNAKGMIHSHRFIAANAVIPWLRHDEKQREMTEEWLKGKASVPEIQSRWAQGPAIKIKIKAPLSVSPKNTLKWSVIITNNKVGHSFPTGPLDLIEAWLVVTVRDKTGKILYNFRKSLERNPRNRRPFILRGIGIDRNGKETITRHNLWDMVAMKEKRSIFVGASQTVFYKTLIPAFCHGPLTIKAVLRYRKFNPAFMRFLFSASSILKALSRTSSLKNIHFPIIDMSESQKRVSLAPL